MDTSSTRSSRGLIVGLVVALLASWALFGLVGGPAHPAGASGTAWSTTTTTAAPGATTTVAPAPAISQVLFINLQSGREDLHRVNMAFQLARNQRAAGRPVTIFFNINAPELATKSLSSALQYKSNAPIKAQVAELIGAGVTVLVCPTCAADQGVTAADLVPGAQITNPQLTGAQLLPGTVTLTY